MIKNSSHMWNESHDDGEHIHKLVERKMFPPIISVVLCIDQAGHGTRENTCYKHLQHAACKLERKVLHVLNQLDVMIYYVIVKFKSQRFSMVMFSSHRYVIDSLL